MSAEYLAKAFFSKNGYTVYSPDSHDNAFDFIASKDGLYRRVQVKSVIEIPKFNLARVRNKHGSTNKLYKVEDYDILAGVWVERNKIYLYGSRDINEAGFGEALTVGKLDGSPLANFKRPVPYYEGDV